MSDTVRIFPHFSVERMQLKQLGDSAMESIYLVLAIALGLLAIAFTVWAVVSR